MFEDWKLGKYMNAAYQVMKQHDDSEDLCRKWTLEQMRELTKSTTFNQAIIALLTNAGEVGKFDHTWQGDCPGLEANTRCVACHIVRAFKEQNES